MKIAINRCHRGFNVSQKALDWLQERGYNGIPYSYEARTNKLLIECIETLGDEAKNSEIKIVEIPDNIEWQIQDYDGKEWIAEKHRTWR